jgi:glycosyltransferase involved in cell wall biosynthesis
MSKTLSVLIPNYNDSAYLAEQLKAVCEQSYKPKEVIVVDDGSTDNSIAVIEEFAREYPNIRLVRNEENRGVIFSINRGAKLATGDYIHFSSANDLVLPGLYEKSMTLLAEHPQAGLCCADVLIIDEVQGVSFDHTRTGWLSSAGYLSPGDLAAATSKRTGLYAPVSNTCIVRRDVLPADDIYIQNLECFSDWFLYQVIVLRYGCCFVPENLAAARVLRSSYGLSVLADHNRCRRILIEAVKLFATPEYEDVAELIVRGRSLLVFRTLVRSPLTAWKALCAVENRNENARAICHQLTSEYLRQIVVRTGKLLGVSAWF